MIAFLGLPLSVQAPSIPLLQEDSLILIQGNSLTVEANRAIIWGLERELWEVAEKYRLNYDLLYNLAVCESTLIHENRWGDNGLSYGLFQWQKRSWDLYNKKFGLNLDRYNLYHQIEMTAKVLSQNGEHNWKQCWKTILIK